MVVSGGSDVILNKDEVNLHIVKTASDNGLAP